MAFKIKAPPKVAKWEVRYEPIDEAVERSKYFKDKTEAEIFRRKMIKKYGKDFVSEILRLGR